MALPEEPLSIVEQWKKRSFEMSSESNDTVVSLLTKGIDTMAVVLNKNSDLDRVQRALVILECERSVSLQFDKIKNDVVRTLVYGLIESLHFTLSELTKERNQVKECGEIFTQTEEIPSWSESPFDENIVENLIKNEDNWVDEITTKGEDIPNDDVDTHNVGGDIAGDRGYSALDNDVMTQSEMPLLSYMGDEYVLDNADANGTMNDLKNNDIMRDEEQKDSSDDAELEKKRKSSKNMSTPATLADILSLSYSDDDSEPVTKKPKADSLKMKNEKSSNVIEKKSGSAGMKSFQTNFRDKTRFRALQCTECSYQTTSAGSFAHHLRYVHFTTLRLAGLALRCDCGVETRSNKHGYKCDIANFTIVRKRDGPIQRLNDKTTHIPKAGTQ